MRILTMIFLGLIVFSSRENADAAAGGTGKDALIESVKPAVTIPYAIPIRITPEGHIFMSVKVDGTEGNFVLDTGAGINVITKKFADRLSGLKREDGCFTGFRATGEALTMQLYRAADIAFGNLDIRNSPLTIIDANLGNIDGLISLTCFRSQPFTIDLVDKKIYLESKTSLESRIKEGQSVPVQLDDDRGVSLDMFTRVRINDKLTLQISLDSGAGYNVYRFNARFMRDLGIDTAAAMKYYKKSTLNPRITNLFYVAGLNRISLASAPSIRADSVRTSFLNGLIYDGITGINWLGKQITIDIPDSEMILH